MKKISFLFLGLMLLFGCKHESTPDVFTVEAFCDSNGYVTPQKVEVIQGGDATFTISTEKGNTISILLNNIPMKDILMSNNTFKITNINSDLIIKVNIKKKKQFTITTVAGPNGTVTPTSAIVDSLGSATFTITPDFGYVIDTIRNNGVVLPSIDKFTFKDVSQNETLNVTFKFKYDEGTPEWYFTQFVWKESETELLIDGYWYYFPMPDFDKKTYWYNPDGTFECLLKGVTYKDASLTWSLDKTTNPITLVTGGKYLKRVEFLDSTTMVIAFEDRDVTHKITYTNNGVRRFK